MDMFDFKKLNKLEPARGRLLISEPFSTDPFFKRTVVLLCEHNENGSFGFVVNKTVEVEINDVIDDFPTFDGSVGMGGPVQRDNLFYLHTLNNEIEFSHEIMKGLYMGGDFDTIKALVIAGKVNPKDLRFFVGYSGWDADQLNNELSSNSWIVAPGDVSTVMNCDAEEMWSTSLKNMGKAYEILSNFPEDPSMN